MRWIWLALLVACGDNVVPRLEPVTYDLAGTTYESPIFFHDRARDEKCLAVPWADGATYCTPVLLPVAFLDDACSEPVALGTTGYAPTMFVLGGKRTVRRVHPVTPRAAPAQYWTSANGTCTGPFTPTADMMWGDLGDELDESAFVRLYRSAPEGRDRLQVIAYNTLDGLHAPRFLHDRDLQVDCVLADGRDRDRVACRPPDAVEAAYFLDASCTQPAIAVPGDAPPFARLGCESYARVGTEVTSPLYTAAGGTCQPQDLPGWHVYPVGDPVELAYATRERHGTGRIQPIDDVAGEAHIPDGLLYDAVLDADCELSPFDGPARCLPASTVPTTVYYADEGCTTERDIAVLFTTACHAAERFAYDTGFRAIGPVVTDPLYVPSTGDRCMLQPPAGEPHDVGPELPLDTFVPAL
ncbi:MAG: hypothetical protein JO257_24690 [Deltaproteobacteria bacterium]|nr:hypothetical protein [Deltaproteobacteria bacterium]